MSGKCKNFNNKKRKIESGNGKEILCSIKLDLNIWVWINEQTDDFLVQKVTKKNNVGQTELP